MFEDSEVYAKAAIASGIFCFCAVLVGAFAWVKVADNQNIRYREEIFKALMNQDPGWYDTEIKATELSTATALQCQRIQKGVFFMAVACSRFATIVVGFVLALWKGWHLCLAMVALMPLMLMVSVPLHRLLREIAAVTLQAYTKAGGVAQEALTFHKTIIAHGQEKKEITRYNKNIEQVSDKIIKKSVGVSLFFALMGL